ncbi:MAG: RNA polymerase sigma factor, partial [Woeseiaceae bacterium]
QARRPPLLSLDGTGDGIPAPAMAVDRIVAARQQLSMLRKVVAELPPKCRKAFLLYKFNEQSYREIAEHMQLSESMIRKYVLRAIVYCRSRIDAERDSEY